MLRTNWYNYLRKIFRDYGVRGNWLLGAKGAKITIEQQKKVPKGSKIRKSAISQQISPSEVQKLPNVEN